MQPIPRKNLTGGISVVPRRAVAREILDAVPPVIWFIRKEMRAHRRGLSMSQFRTLCKINSEPAASLSAVAEHLEASLPTASRIVAILVKKGFVARKGCSADRRQMELVLTGEGRAVLEEGWSATQAEIEKKIALLGEGERATLEQAMKICKELFGAVGVPENAEALPSGSVDGAEARAVKRRSVIAAGAD